MFGIGGAKRSKGLVGIEVGEAGIAIARVVRPPKGKPLLTHCDFISRDAISSELDTLRERIATQGLAGEICNWVLCGDTYALLLVESPNVPAEELRSAMRWKVKDLIPFAVEQAALDIFPLPADGSRANNKMHYVVVSEKRQIESTITLTKTAKLRLSSVDIVELSLRNLVETLLPDTSGIGIVRLSQGKGHLSLVREDRLYLSRHFDLKYSGGLLDALPEESLILELQRSIDYYERQMGQAAPANLYFCGENILPDKITQTMRNSLPAKVQCLPLCELLGNTKADDEPLLQMCIGAIGGALRMQAA